MYVGLQFSIVILGKYRMKVFYEKYWKYTDLQPIHDVDEFVSS